MAIKLNVKSVNIIWHVLPFQLRPDAQPAASPRIARCVGTWKAARRHAVRGASGALLLPVVGKLVDRRKGENVNVNVNLKCFSMLPEGEAYNSV